MASILLLPSELKLLIVELSSGSRSSLAALALTHSSFQREAEKALYDSIYAYSEDDLKCMETLATNPEKAALVRFLNIEYAYDNVKNNRMMTSYLSKSLTNMHTLTDLRIKSRINGPSKMWHWYKRLSEILCQGHFQLQTLYCNDVPNIRQIIERQTDLQIFGIYEHGSYGSRHIAETLKELHNAQSFLPIVVILAREGFLPYARHITTFPLFYSVDRWATMHQVLTQSFCKDQGYSLVANADNIDELSIYLIDYSDIPSISALLKSMAVGFPRIHYLNLCFDRRPEIPSGEIKERFPFLSNFGVNSFNW